MAGINFIGASYRARSVNFDNQRCINLYPEMSQSGTSKAIAALYGTPGLSLFATPSSAVNSGIRGVIRFSATKAFVVSGASVYSVTTAGVCTLIGTIAYASTPVSMASNGIVIMLVTGAQGYVITPSTNAIAQITDPDFSGADKVDFIDNYFVFNKPGTGQFQITGLLDTSIDPLDFATAEGSPDLLVSLIVDHRELWLFGENSTEVFFNSGNPDFPFERIQGAFIEQGCAAKFSPAKMDNTIFWLTANDEGQGMIVKAIGYQPQRISTHAIEYAITQYPRIDDAVAYCYQQEGHSFYVISFPSGNVTWVYDASTELWHERAWRNPVDASLNRHRSNFHMMFGGVHIVGDWEIGNLYKLDLDVYTDNGGILPAIRQTANIGYNDGKWTTYHRFHVDMETGVGLNSGQGSDPQAMLSWSDDGGHTFKNERSASFGLLGEFKRQVNYRRLGKSRNGRVFRFTITDPVKRALIAGDCTMSAGAS